MKSNKAFSLLELILVISISSFVLIFVFKFSKDLYFAENETKKISILKIDLNSTKIIIEKNLPDIINKLEYKDKTLYIDNNILLKEVSSFSLMKGTKKVIIDITLDDKISQKWEFEL
ncbi:prepilin-type N-terminal cleavage/methylation domain-containing protein [Halarcobacter sp.]|uniref:type II secretion system protein n=1 Tax=Halarcobacter sp. TaxID=2321133 RepID=UPI002AA70CBC|nr:prepilin-type N-terminal cleavage/methylation domain-containing protein [Halarcobacter sp.]